MDAAMPAWDPDRYLAYADERGRAFHELLARVPATDPARVVDLGCGPGHLTGRLVRRWPRSEVVGIDSSPEMVARARADHEGTARERLRFELGDLRAWLDEAEPGPEPEAEPEPVDVVVANAVLQWVPDHLALLPALVTRVAPGGWLAFQVPAMDQDCHTLCRDLAEQPPYAPHTRGVAAPDAHDAATYRAALAAPGCRVDAWETTYLHLLTGEDPVFAWTAATGARPTLRALPPELRDRFERDLKGRLRVAYPPGPDGVVMPFGRVFVVAQVPAPRGG